MTWYGESRDGWEENDLSVDDTTSISDGGSWDNSTILGISHGNILRGLCNLLGSWVYLIWRPLITRSAYSISTFARLWRVCCHLLRSYLPRDICYVDQGHSSFQRHNPIIHVLPKSLTGRIYKWKIKNFYCLFGSFSPTVYARSFMLIISQTSSHFVMRVSLA